MSLILDQLAFSIAASVLGVAGIWYVRGFRALAVRMHTNVHLQHHTEQKTHAQSCLSFGRKTVCQEATAHRGTFTKCLPPF